MVTPNFHADLYSCIQMLNNILNYKNMQLNIIITTSLLHFLTFSSQTELDSASFHEGVTQ